MISLLGTGTWSTFGAAHASLLQTWHILLAALCGMLKHRQQQIIEFHNAQIKTLQKKLGRSDCCRTTISVDDFLRETVWPDFPRMMAHS